MQQVWRPAPGVGHARRVDGALQLNVRRLRVRPPRLADLRFRAIVAHSGGLPGFGSVMRWLPEYGVGIIAFGNLTYTGWGRVVDEGVRRAGEDRRAAAAQPQPSPALDRRARRRVAARREVGRRAGGQHRRRESVPRSVEGSPARRDRARCTRRPARARPAAASTTSRTRCAALDDELRAGKAGGGDHARADDAAEGAVPVGGPTVDRASPRRGRRVPAPVAARGSWRPVS